MGRLLRFIERSRKGQRAFFVAAVILAGCSLDTNELKGYPGIDSSAAVDGPFQGIDGQNRILDGNSDAGPEDSSMSFDSQADAAVAILPDAPADFLSDGAVDSPKDTSLGGVSDVSDADKGVSVADAPGGMALDFAGDSLEVRDLGTGGATGLGGTPGMGGSGDNSMGGSGGIPLNMGGSTATGGTVTGTGGVMIGGTAGDSGGTVGTGGGTMTGGTPMTGGTFASGGSVGTGGTTASGGVVETGGTTAVTCGTAKSDFSETVTFLDGGTSPLALSPAVPPVGAQLGYTTAGPASNPTLCTAGCATLSMAFTAGMAKYLFLSAIQGFASVVNLVGATVTFTIAIDNPGVPIQVQAYATGDASTTWAWTTPTTINGTALTSYAAATGFKDLSVAPIDGTTTKYCASATALIGIELQNTVAITSANAGTVTIYISKITIKPPA
jgi:hypothetical protein